MSVIRETLSSAYSKEVADAVRDSNNDVGGRILELSQREYYVRGRGYIQDLAGIEKIALRAHPRFFRSELVVRPNIRSGRR